MAEPFESRITRAPVWSWIARDGRCVVVRNERRAGSTWWSVPGGGVEPGETLAEGAQREETGLAARLGAPLRLRDRVAGDGRRLEAAFAPDAVGGTIGDAADPTGKSKMREVRWAGPAEVEQLLGPQARPILEELLRLSPWPGGPICREVRAYRYVRRRGVPCGRASPLDAKVLQHVC